MVELEPGSVQSLGLLGIDCLHYYVRDVERSQRFYVDRMDFAEPGESGPKLTREGRQRSVAFQAGGCVVVCSTPAGEGGRAWRYLSKHPDGIGTIVFRVEDIDRTFRFLEERGATPIQDVQRVPDQGGRFCTFSITTPFGDTTFRFVQRIGTSTLYPGLVPHSRPLGATNAFGFTHFDHVTSNFQTMLPALMWLERVMGFERFWEVQFHTDDVSHDHGQAGSGLRSAVLWDAQSGIKFANNEPQRPHFKASQINVFHEEHRGDGVQHVALGVSDIISAVRGLRERGVEFMRTPSAYYDLLPGRLERSGIGTLDEDLDTLRELEILVDGAERGRYLLQIFIKDSAGLYASPEAGPFFYEIIQRKGDQGFGAGNFRALFESIERQQQQPGRS
jgi:4-hydroxyphenylpyruvate dioxygenase